MDFNIAYLIYMAIYAQGSKPLNKAEYRVGLRVWYWKYLWLAGFIVGLGFFFPYGKLCFPNFPLPCFLQKQQYLKMRKRKRVTKVKRGRRKLKEEKDKQLFLYCPQQTKSKRMIKRNDEHAESLKASRTTLCKKHLNNQRLILIWSKNY